MQSRASSPQFAQNGGRGNWEERGGWKKRCWRIFGYTMYGTRWKGERGFTVICRNFGDHHCGGREGLWWEISWFTVELLEELFHTAICSRELNKKMGGIQQPLPRTLVCTRTFA